VDISLLDNPGVGDHVLVHAGFAIDMVDLEEAQKRIAMLREIKIDAAG
jgi:hydrogenase assembly chaperone HypC/HupF